jgi:hypothetical protein
MARRSRGLTWCGLVALATVTTSARAEPAGAGTAMDDADVAARLAFLERALDAEEASTRLWRSSWLAAYGGVTLVETGLLAIASTPALRLSSGVSVGSAAIGFTFRLLSPASGADAAGKLRGVRAETPAERREKLHRAEALLHRVAVEERFSHSWFPLIGGALVAAGGAWINFAARGGSAGAGWFAATSSLAVAELEFHTQPTAAIRAWDAYQRGGAGARLASRPASPSVALVPFAMGEGGGAAIRGVF